MRVRTRSRVLVCARNEFRLPSCGSGLKKPVSASTENLSGLILFARRLNR